MKKFLSIFFSLAAAAVVPAAEIVNLCDPGVWREESAVTALPDGSIKVSGRVTLTSVDYPRIHRNKKYTLRGKVRLAPGSVKSNFGLGFILLNDEEAAFPLASFRAVKDSYGTLAKDVKKGDRVISVKAENPKVWRAIPGYQVAFKVKRDMSDIPNKNVSGGEKFRKLETAADGTIMITLPYAMKFDLPAGSLVRLHTGYSYYNRMVYYSSLTYDWKEFSVSMSGTLKTGEFDGKGFPPAEEVEALKLYINCNGTTPAAVTELKDLQLVIE
ncbi:MAG: hypothetical protein E7058_10480 [Lentisphaerae bacterium]|nr:hypothetical protein [Lentisphaerota bacterium]